MAGCGAGLDLQLPLLPGELKAAGYATHMLGKWHLGFRTQENLPTGRGFDSYLGLLGGGSDHFDKTLCIGPGGGGIGSLCPCVNTAPIYPFRVDYTDGDKPAKSLWDNTTYGCVPKK